MMEALVQSGVFAIVVLTAFGVGWFLLGASRLHLRQHELWVVGISLGVVAWTLSLYAAWILGIRELVTPIFLGLSLWTWWHKLGNWKAFPSFKGNLVPAMIILAGVVAQLFLVAPSGLEYEDGLRSYGVNAHDGVWHVALMMTLQGSYPPEMPTYSGTSLLGYHYMVDLFGSELVRFFGLSAFWLVFRLLPALFSVLMGLGVYGLVMRVSQSKLGGVAGLFLTYFGGSLGYVLWWWGNNRWSESSFWAQQSITTLINLPLSVSFVLMLVVSLLLVERKDKKYDRWHIFLAAIVAGSLVAFKAHTGILVMAGYGLWTLLYLIKHKQPWVLLPAGLSLLLFGGFVFSQLSENSGMLFEPGWFIKTMMEASDRVGWVQWELWRQSMILNEQWIKVGMLWVLAGLLFVVGNMGARILGLSVLLDKKLFQKHGLWLWFWLVIAGLGFLLPLLFIQKGIVWNTIQFFYVTLFVMNIVTALIIGRVKDKALQVVLVTGIVLLSLPTTIKTIVEYAGMYSQGRFITVVSKEEFEALTFLASQPEGVVLAAYDETAIISALSGKSVFYADETQAVLLGLDFEERKTLLSTIMCTPMRGEEVHHFVNVYHIRYIYLPSAEPDCDSRYLADMNFLQQIYSQGGSRILEYKSD